MDRPPPAFTTTTRSPPSASRTSAGLPTYRASLPGFGVPRSVHGPPAGRTAVRPSSVRAARWVLPSGPVAVTTVVTAPTGSSGPRSTGPAQVPGPVQRTTRPSRTAKSRTAPAPSVDDHRVPREVR
ncbi:hypothetical protein E9529_14820 [Blastococcus sp. KM273128]|nr:hypothetical protein [Blastococcus sp. KM273128]